MGRKTRWMTALCCCLQVCFYLFAAVYLLVGFRLRYVEMRNEVEMDLKQTDAEAAYRPFAADASP